MFFDVFVVSMSNVQGVHENTAAVWLSARLFFPLISIDSAPPKAIYAGTTGNRLSICPETAYKSPIETSPLDGSHDVMISHRIHRNFVWTGVAIFTDMYFYQHVMFDFYRSSCTTVQWIGVMQHVFLILGAPMKSWVQSRVDETIWLMPSQQLTFGYFWLR